MANIIGIDLGTTNSLVSVFRNGEPEVIPNALGQLLTPSVVGVDDDGALLVGEAARDRLVTHPDQTAASFKRYMGTARQIPVGDRMYRPEELSAFVLKALRADAEAFLGEPVDEAVVTVPAYFSDAQRKATRAAGQLAGVRVERLLNEPTAAALAYGLQDRGADQTFLVFDLGGGTFDVSLLELFDGVMEVRASAGDNFLGGDDFVHRIMDGFVHHHDNASILGDPVLRGLLRAAATRALKELSFNRASTVQIPVDGEPLAWPLDEAVLQRLCAPLIDKLRAPIERALRDARVKASELDDVVMVGGASRIRIVREMAARAFGRIPSTSIDPDKTIALGAAVQAGLKARDAALEDIVMTDVCPFTLGTSISRKQGDGKRTGGHYFPILERNCAVPVSRVERLYTVEHNQRKIIVDVYQGESRVAKDNILLGRLDILVPPRPAGVAAIDVRFTYDINGILEVETTVVESGETKRLLIEDNPGVLKPEEIEKRLAALQSIKVHPRDRAENRAAMARAERLYEERLGDLRMAIGQRAADFQAVLESQDPTVINEARKSFLEFLEQIEQDPYAL